MSGKTDTAKQRRMYRELRERIERSDARSRQQRQRQLLIERLVQQQRERHLRSFRHPTR
jgi:hypothetical protein